MKTIVILFLLVSFNAQPQCLEMDIVILGDFSGSVQGKEEFVVDAIETFSRSVKGGENVRIGVVLFDDDPKLIADLTNDIDNLVSSTHYYRDAQASGSTNIESALQMAANVLLETQNNSRKLVILISDGVVTAGGSSEQTIFTASQMARIGIGICSVLIKSASSDPEFMKEVSGGCYAESDYENLANELRSLNICL